MAYIIEIEIKKINQSTIVLCSKNYAQIIRKNPWKILHAVNLHNYLSSLISFSYLVIKLEIAIYLILAYSKSNYEQIFTIKQVKITIIILRWNFYWTTSLLSIVSSYFFVDGRDTSSVKNLLRTDYLFVLIVWS